jgi:threonine dehydrogenase-like Zn-dependent dehydrogenase
VKVSKQRRKFAQQFGAHHIIDPTSEDVVQKVKKLTKGYGADVGFDAAGVQIAVDSAIKAVRARGTLVNIALWGAKRVALDMMDMVFGERKYQAVVTYTEGDFEAVIDAIATGKIQPKGMITKVIGVDQVDEGFKALVEDKDNQVRTETDLRSL